MEYVGITLSGLENTAIQEIKEKTGSDTERFDTLIKFESKELVEFQSLTRVLKFITYGKFEEEIDFSKIDFSFVEEPFKVKCQRIGEHDFASLQLERELGELIHEKFGKRVSIRNPKSVIYVYVYNNTYVVGEDVLQEDLAKREYKLKTTPASINSCIEYAAVRLSGYKKGETLVDPFCKTSEILIEASLHAKGNLIGFDHIYSNIKNSRLNAKIAEVELELHHGGLSWIETKLDKGSVDHMVTILTLRNDKAKLKQLFEQAKFALKDKGNLTIISISQLEHKDFKKTKEVVVKKGDNFYIQVFERLNKD